MTGTRAKRGHVDSWLPFIRRLIGKQELQGPGMMPQAVYVGRQQGVLLGGPPENNLQ